MPPRIRPPCIRSRCYSTTTETKKKTLEDPRLRNLGKELRDEFAMMRDTYKKPKNPVVLCHGLMGFDKLRLAGDWVPGIEYWRGISDCLQAGGVEVIVSTVPPTSSIEQRAEALAKGIRKQLGIGRSVNLIGHSMGGIDPRYMISKLKPTEFKVLSLTTVATPHHGSSFADYMLDTIGPNLPQIYGTLNRIGLQTSAFSQLTTSYMNNVFNVQVPDDPAVSYFSYGSYCNPPIYSIWRIPHNIIMEREGPNDGLVSVESSRWGTYEGTLVGVNHLGIINWVNRIEYVYGRIVGRKMNFNALAFYCGIADKLAGKGF